MSKVYKLLSLEAFNLFNVYPCILEGRYLFSQINKLNNMSWIKDTLTSSIGRKLVMSLTGLFLIVFLLTHLIGNLSLLKCDGGDSFNEYAHMMKHNPLIMVGEIVMFLAFVFHIVDGFILLMKNRAARPIGYAVSTKSKTRSFASKMMGPLGMAIMVLLLWHLYNFFSYKYTAELMGGISMVTVNGVDMPDLASIVYVDFNQLYQVIIYLVFMIILSFHLHHGFRSAFQSLGLSHKKYNKLIKYAGTAYAILVPLGFALLPILIYLGKYGVGSCCAAH